MKKTLWVLAQVAWIAICVLSLIESYRGYRGASDWQVEEGLAFEMVVLSFPASVAVVLAFVAAGVFLKPFGLALPASSKPEMIITWLLFVVAGYAQWFIFRPRIRRWWRNTRHRQHSGI
jgi:hypothetical protein